MVSTLVRPNVRIQPITLEMVTDEANYELCRRWAELSRRIFNTWPWNDGLPVARLAWGIPKDMAKPHAAAYVALASHPDGTVRVNGFVLGYRASVEGLRHTSGTDKLDHVVLEGGPTVYLDAMGVRESKRRQGLGSALLVPFLEKIEAHGISRVVLRTDPRSEGAVPFYESFGFHDLGVTDGRDSERIWMLRK